MRPLFVLLLLGAFMPTAAHSQSPATLQLLERVAGADTVRASAAPADSVARDTLATRPATVLKPLSQECRQHVLVRAVEYAMIGAVAGAVVFAVPAGILSLARFHTAARVALLIPAMAAGAFGALDGTLEGLFDCDQPAS